MAGTKLEFPGSQGATLAARLDAPSAPPLAVALFAHCFTCSKETKAATYIAKALVEQGIAVLRFDFTGLGGSEGEFANSNFSSNVEDLLAAAAALRSRYGAPQILIGHSLGGAAVLAAAGAVPEARGVVTIAAPFDPGQVKRQFAQSLSLIEREGEAQVTLAGRPFTLRKQFLDDLDTHLPAETIRDLRRPLLLFHAPNDTTVSIDNAQRIYEAARHPKSFISLDDADHLLTRSEDGRYVGQVIAAWVQRYLPLREAAPAVPAGTVRVAERGTGKFANVVQTASNTIFADEPESVGGSGTGLTPYELLQAALGACTSMTLRMYAELKKLPLRRVSVELKHDKIHAQDCADCETKEGRIDQIERVIALEGDVDEQQRAKLLEIADKCPVHRTLHSEVVIRTRLSE